MFDTIRGEIHRQRFFHHIRRLQNFAPVDPDTHGFLEVFQTVPRWFLSRLIRRWRNSFDLERRELILCACVCGRIFYQHRDCTRETVERGIQAGKAIRPMTHEGS